MADDPEAVAGDRGAVIQLVAVNAVALAFFGERLTAIQGVGVALAIVAVALVTLGPYLQGR